MTTAAAAEPRLVGFFELDNAIPELAAGESPRSWIQVMVAGKFDHARYGKFTIADQDLEGFAADIAARGARIPIDFDHDSADGRTLAAGWFTGRTRIEPGEPAKLFAEVEWTPPGAEAVRTKQYRYISPEFDWKRRSAEGKVERVQTMYAAALTNRPFLPGMEPVTLSDAPQTNQADFVESLAATLGVPTEDVIRLAEWTTGYINDLPDKCFLYIEPGGEKDADGKTTPRSLRHFPVRDSDGTVDLPHVRNALARIPQSNVPAAAKQRAAAKARRLLTNAGGTAASSTEEENMEMQEIAAGLELDQDADAEAILAAVKARNDTIAALTSELETLKASVGETEKLQARIEAMEAERETEKKDRLFADAVKAGKLVPAQREKLLAVMDSEALTALIDATPEHSFKLAAVGDGGAGGAEPSVEEARRALRLADDTPVDEDSLKLDAKAREILKAREITAPTAQQYSDALVEAERAIAS